MKKEEIISFKVDPELGEAMRNIPNRSRFIRSAILAAMAGVCPLCDGSGVLTPSQKKHWDEFSVNHALERCGKCDSRFLVCLQNEEG